MKTHYKYSAKERFNESFFFINSNITIDKPGTTEKKVVNDNTYTIKNFFMKKIRHTTARFAIMFVIASLFLTSHALAQKTWDGGAGTSNWGDANNWSPNGVPGSSDAVTIASSTTVTINITNAVCGSLQLGKVGGSSAQAGSLSFATTGSPSLTISGALILGGTSSTNGSTGTVTFKSGATLTAGSLQVGGSNGGNTGIITMTSGGTLILNGGITIGSDAGTWTPGTGTLQLNATNTLPSTIFTTFNNLIINGGTTTSSGVAFTAGFVTVSAGNLILSATNVDYGITNDLIVSSGATLTHSVNWDVAGKLLKVGGNIAIDGTFAYTARSHVQMITGGKSVRTGNTSGSAFSILTFTHTSGTISASGLLNVNDNFWASFNTTGGTFSTNGQTVNANSGLLNAGGTININGGTLNITGGFSVGTSTTNGAVTMSSGTLNTDGITIGTGATPTGTFAQLGGTANVTGSVTINASSSYTCTNSPAINISGSWTNNGAFSAGTSTVNFNGTGTQTIGGSVSSTFNNLNMSGSGTLQLSFNTSITGNLAISSGVFDASTFTANRTASGGSLTLSNGATLMMAGTNTLPSNYSTHSIGATSTINYYGANQTIANLNSSQVYGNIVLAGSGTKTFSATTKAITNNLSVSSGVIALFPSSNTYTAGTLTLSGTGQLNGSYGGSASSATFKNSTYFGTTTSGILNVTTSTAPTVNTSGSLTAMSTTYGAASTATIVSISGSRLVANITATAPTGFEISSDGTTFGTTAIFTQSGGTVSGTLSVRLAATANVSGTYNSQSVVLSTTGATNVNVTSTSTGNTVSAASLSITAVAQSKTYGGTVSTSGVLNTTYTVTGLKNSDAINGETLSYSGSPTGNLATAAVGSYTITPSSASFSTGIASNYTILYNTGTLTVNTTALTVVASAQSKTYGVAIATTGVLNTTFTVNGLQNSDAVNGATLGYSGSPAGNLATAAVGSYTITPSAVTFSTGTSSNYTIIYNTGALTINKAGLTITASTQSKLYGATVSTAGVLSTTFTVSGLQNSDVVNGATLGYSGSPAGNLATAAVASYTITPSAATFSTGLSSNYTITYNTGTLTVNKAGLTITASAQSKTYGATVSTTGVLSTTFTVSGLQNSDAVNGATLGYNGSPAGNLTTASVGSYTITPSAATFSTGSSSNYTITYSTGILTVNTASLTITANNSTKAYGSIQTSSVSGSTAFSSTGLANSETIGSVTLNYGTGALTATAPAGSTSTITPSAATGGTFNANNYSISYSANSGTLTVVKASLSITANDQSKSYGQPFNFTGLEFSTSGLQNGETIGSITLTSSGAISTATVTGGPYGIVPSEAIGGTFNINNYTVTYTNGALAVNKIPLTIKANNQTKCSGIAFIFIGTEFTSSGLLFSDAVSSVTLTSSGSATGASAGSYNIVPSAATGTGLGNYTITYTNGTFTVNQSQIVSVGSALSYICVGSVSAPLGGSISGAATSATWDDGGVGGTFTPNATSLNATWTPPASFVGTATLTLTTMGTGPCGSVTASKTQVVDNSCQIITIAEPTQLTASISNTVATICAGQSSTITIAVTGGTAPYYINGTQQTGAGPFTITVSPISTTTYNSSNVIVSDSHNCTSSTTGSASITVYDIPTTSNAGNNQVICSNSTAVLTANTAVTGTGMWAVVSGPNTSASQFSNTTESNAVFAPTASGTYILSWTISNGVCNASSSNVQITITQAPNASISYAIDQCTASGTIAVMQTGNTGGTFSSTTGLVIDSSTGDINLALSKGGNYTVAYSVEAAGGCSNLNALTNISIKTSTWIGNNSTDWAQGSNWSCGSVPTAGFDIIIPGNLNNYPVLSSAISINNLSFSSNNLYPSTLTIGANALTVTGSINNYGTFGGSSYSSLILGNGTNGYNPTLNFTTGHDTLFSLTLNTNATATIGSTLKLAAPDNVTPASLTVGLSAVLNTADGLTLVSDANNTAIVNPVLGVINGNVNVQTYIPAKRAWRLLTAPVTNSNSIYESWQNNGIAYSQSDASTFYKGTLITNTGDLTGTGMDANSSASLKTFNIATQSLTAVTNTHVPISQGNANNADNTGYFIFIRGDRNPATVGNPNFGPLPLSNTVLSSKGKLQTGPQSFIIPAFNTTRKYMLIGNPYASPIDFTNVERTNIVNRFYTWDPTLNTVGAYVVVDDAANLGSYIVSTSGKGTTKQDKNIQSGQAFIVENLAAANPCILTVNESDKSSKTNKYVFRPVDNPESFRTSLYLLNEDSSTVLADGNLVQFNNNYSAAIDVLDAMKLSNTNENISILRSGSSLAIERRPIIRINDTLFLKFTNSTQRKYRFEFTAINLDHPNLVGWFVDNYTGISKEINLNGSTIVDFSVDANVASQSNKRFSVIFGPLSSPLPVTFTSIKAQQKNTAVAIEWNVSNEANIKAYEVEKSTDGKTFITISTNVAQNSQSYNTIDNNVTSEINYYRIRSIDNNGQVTYSATVKISVNNKVSAITAYSTTIINKTISLQFTNMPKGDYFVRLINTAGQEMERTIVSHSGGTVIQNIAFKNAFAKGVYHLEILKPDNKNRIISVVY
ncbi:MBG domain-containing protein [Ferruginibacter albus]|uniref:MBG domain-containing protein n=1 Tax=Ferruginibacter albus TaxID=2875540 RepID=UPI001CC816EF|nr:MBG domain-containing protein [Ferruginibacter albus]UAY52834.1 hypothetical protein K9M53_03935 [Ferruginibacter albus]